MMAAPPPELSVVILCYRAEDLIPSFVRRMKEVLEERNLNYELVLVANHDRGASNTDRTPEIVRGMAKYDPALRIVAGEKQGGMGWDMRNGLAAASGRTVAVIDGDGQMPPEDVIRIYDLLREGSLALAKTYRKERQDGFHRLIISRIYNILLKTLFPKVKVRDANSKPKIFTRNALEKLKLYSDGWFIDAEIVIQASYRGLSMGEIPTIFYKNTERASFITTSAIAGFLKDLLLYRLKSFFIPLW